jgi:hypothetical protein
LIDWETIVKRISSRVAAVAVLVVVGAAAIALPLARAQVQVTANYVPIGVAASGTTSTVWFHQPASGHVLACQSVSTTSAPGPSGIHCVSAKLP